LEYVIPNLRQVNALKDRRSGISDNFGRILLSASPAPDAELPLACRPGRDASSAGSMAMQRYWQPDGLPQGVFPRANEGGNQYRIR
jgi:hypothetical protein